MTATADAPVITAEDGRPRAADPRPPKAPVTDPEAPYGWMADKSAPGGRRPKLRPGKQAGGSKKAVAPPPSRGKARTRPAPAEKAATKYIQPLTDLTQTVWMVLASSPALPFIPDDANVKLKAQAAILESNQTGIVQGVNLAAQNVPMIGKGIDALTGGAVSWIVPATFALLPFVAQSAVLWKQPLGEHAGQLAGHTAETWQATIEGFTDPSQDGAPADDQPDAG